jgi:signal transduction histidine kinase
MAMGSLSPDADVLVEQGILLQFIYQCPVGLVDVDNRGNVRLLNAVGVALLIPIAGAHGFDNFFTLMRPHANALVELIEAPGANGELCRNHRIPIQQSGAVVQLSFTVIRLDPDTLMVAFEDVTAMAAAEQRAHEALEAQAVQSGRVEMASTVLHDIGNAITGIGTRSAQLLADPAWPEIENLARMSSLLQSQAALLAPVLGERKATALGGLASALERSLREREITLREHIRSLVSSVAHIQEILSVQRQYVQHGSAGPRSPVVLAELVHDAIAIHSPGLRKRSIELVRHLAADLPRLRLDRTRMVQVLGNLIRNACESFDSLDETKIVRRLEISAENLEPGWVRLVVRDNGSGFSPQHAESFFERGATTKSHGSGIGLASSRATVESHGGKMRMESDGIGKGAAVTIDLPAA